MRIQCRKYRDGKHFLIMIRFPGVVGASKVPGGVRGASGLGKLLANLLAIGRVPQASWHALVYFAMGNRLSIYAAGRDAIRYSKSELVRINL